MLAAILQRVANGELRRVMVFMPPRHGKSELVSRLFPAYFLYRFPDRWVGINSYAADLAYTLSRAARDNFLAGGGQIRGDAGAVKHWETTSRGGLWAAGVGGPITGKGWHLGIIDDPLKNSEEAHSETIRAKQKEWYGSTFYTREEPNNDGDPDGALIVVQTRWHEDDLSGWLLSEEEGGEEEQPEGWHIANFAGIKEEAERVFPSTCTVEPDWRETGEALCPERRPLEKLRRIARRIGEYFFGALYQQDPRPAAGGMFQEDWFEKVNEVPAGCSFVRYWDKAGAAPGKGDYTVGTLMGRSPDDRYFVVDVVRGQWPADKRNEHIRAAAEGDAERYGRVGIFVEQPPGLGKESTEAVIRLLAGFNAEADPVRKEKAERAEPFSAQCRAGNVRLVRAPWNRVWIAELISFPNAAHDDQVDASAGAFNKLAVYRKPESGSPVRSTAGHHPAAVGVGATGGTEADDGAILPPAPVRERRRGF